MLLLSTGKNKGQLLTGANLVPRSLFYEAEGETRDLGTRLDRRVPTNDLKSRSHKQLRDTFRLQFPSRSKVENLKLHAKSARSFISYLLK